MEKIQCFQTRKRQETDANGLRKVKIHLQDMTGWFFFIDLVLQYYLLQNVAMGRHR